MHVQKPHSSPLLNTTKISLPTMSSSSGDDNNNNDNGQSNPSPGPHQNPTLPSDEVRTPTRTPRGGAGRASRRPRRRSDPGASSSRAKGVLDAPENPPPCEVCGRLFSSWKALFGHMRSHPERSWRGVKPPPVFTPPGSPNRDEPENVLIRALLQVGENVLGRDLDQWEMGEATSAAAVECTSSPARVYFDLNDDPMEEDSPSPKKKKMFGLDLNKPAPEDDDDDQQ